MEYLNEVFTEEFPNEFSEYWDDTGVLTIAEQRLFSPSEHLTKRETRVDMTVIRAKKFGIYDEVTVCFNPDVGVQFFEGKFPIDLYEFVGVPTVLHPRGYMIINHGTYAHVVKEINTFRFGEALEKLSNSSPS